MKRTRDINRSLIFHRFAMAFGSSLKEEERTAAISAKCYLHPPLPALTYPPPSITSPTWNKKFFRKKYDYYSQLYDYYSSQFDGILH